MIWHKKTREERRKKNKTPNIYWSSDDNTPSTIKKIHRHTHLLTSHHRLQSWLFMVFIDSSH